MQNVPWWLFEKKSLQSWSSDYLASLMWACKHGPSCPSSALSMWNSPWSNSDHFLQFHGVLGFSLFGHEWKYGLLFFYYYCKSLWWCRVVGIGALLSVFNWGILPVSCQTAYPKTNASIQISTYYICYLHLKCFFNHLQYPNYFY